MGKKKSTRRTSQMYESDDDTESTTTTISSEFAFDQNIETIYDDDSTIDAFLDSLYEKRSSVREAGLKGIINSFSNNFQMDYAENKFETLTRQFLGCVKKGSEAEVVLACKALGLLSITLGKGSQAELILNESSQHLTFLSKHNSHSSTRVAALEALAILNIFGFTDYDMLENAMQVFFKLGINDQKGIQNKKITPAVRESAIRAWMLLFSILPDDYHDKNKWKQEVYELSSLLNDDNLCIKNVAGQAIALLLENTSNSSLNDVDFDDVDYGGGYAYDNYGGNNDNESYNDHEASEEKNKNENYDDADDDDYGYDDYGDDHEHIFKKMDNLAKGSNKKQSKKSNKLQKQSFREIISSMKENSFSESKIKLKGNQSIQISSWTQNTQINALRKILGSGFQCHLQENTQLYENFEFELVGGKTPVLMSSVEKRMYQSPNSMKSKARTQSRRVSRSASQNHNFSYLHCGDD